MIKKQNIQIEQIFEENEKLKENLKLKEETLNNFEICKKDLQEKSKKIEDENMKYIEKFQKQEEKISKATEKLKKFKDELTLADEEFKEAQNYIKKQKEIKENLEKHLKDVEEKLKNYENLLTNKANNNNKNNFQNPQTVKPSELNKNMKPTLNKYPTIQNKENYFPNDNIIDEEAKKNNGYMKNPKEINYKNSKELFGGDNKITEIQKDYIKNIYDEKYKIHENNKKRRMENEPETIIAKDKNKIDFPKSFGFKQMKFL